MSVEEVDEFYYLKLYSKSKDLTGRSVVVTQSVANGTQAQITALSLGMRLRVHNLKQGIKYLKLILCECPDFDTSDITRLQQDLTNCKSDLRKLTKYSEVSL